MELLCEGVGRGGLAVFLCGFNLATGNPKQVVLPTALLTRDCAPPVQEMMLSFQDHLLNIACPHLLFFKRPTIGIWIDPPICKFIDFSVTNHHRGRPERQFPEHKDIRHERGPPLGALFRLKLGRGARPMHRGPGYPLEADVDIVQFCQVIRTGRESLPPGGVVRRTKAARAAGYQLDKETADGQVVAVVASCE